jgi:hypothetical protein
MRLEILSGEFGWLNNNASTSTIPPEYKKSWSQWLSGSIKALNSSPLVASQGANVKVDKKGVHIEVSGSTFDYKGNLKIKGGKIRGGVFH